MPMSYIRETYKEGNLVHKERIVIPENELDQFGNNLSTEIGLLRAVNIWNKASSHIEDIIYLYYIP